MKFSEMLASQPPPLSIAGARLDIRERLLQSKRRLVVIDDAPDDCGAVNDVSIYLDWSAETLDRALSSDNPVFFLSTDSPASSREDATRIAQELGRNLSEAAGKLSANPLICRGSDSSLRGHFPQEVDALALGLDWEFDGAIIAPAFFEAGRYTINDTHWAIQEDELVSMDKTEYARDSVFGFRNSNLKQWVEEKTSGSTRADRVRSISLQCIRNGGPSAVENELMQTFNGQPVVVNAACCEDLEVFVLGLIAAETRGKRFMYYCAPSFVKIRGGFLDQPFLTCEQMRPGNGPGLLVAGSSSDITSRQLQALIDSKLVVGVELRVDALLDTDSVEAEIARSSKAVNTRLAEGDSVALHTPRTRHSISASSFRKLGHTITTGLREVTRRIDIQPGFVISKGRITAKEVAGSLGLKEALALGQVIPGVPVWRLEKADRWAGIPYVIFPGDVGDDNALVDVFVRCDSVRHSRILHLR